MPAGTPTASHRKQQSPGYGALGGASLISSSSEGLAHLGAPPPRLPQAEAEERPALIVKDEVEPPDPLVMAVQLPSDQVQLVVPATCTTVTVA